MSDFTTRPEAEDEWENLLREWRTQSHAQPRPYFYNRVRARLVSEAELVSQPLRAWLRWPAYVAILGIVLMLSGDAAALRSADNATWYEAHLSGK